MNDAANDRGERQGRVLAELAELGMSLARRAHALAMAAETPEEVGRVLR